MASLCYSTIPFEPWHAEALVPHDVLARFTPHDSVTLWEGQTERAIACAGIVPLWPGSGYAWFLACADAQNHKHAMARFARTSLAARLPAFRRVEALIPATAMTVRRFAQWLGFREVLYKQQYGPQGEDFVECVWLREPEDFYG